MNDTEKAKWQDELYKKTFEEELTGLSRRRLSDASCDIGSLENLLKGLYIMDGADWLGRGEVQEIILSAQIAAYERFISEWKTGAALTGADSS
ncbi:MAG: hypothetical protein LBG79_08155 [Spirochaetaceae bacterium]|jgi:hypothetical protein|nr:hypothetical protein [Spirochaetaceae bacterium]GMO27428.1 MAG: hypothetical protein Pg6A_14990 [Termitinemataceae bacterium]